MGFCFVGVNIQIVIPKYTLQVLKYIKEGSV